MTEQTAKPLSLVDLLNQLAAPQDPAAISMMPQTQGWVVLALMGAVGGVLCTIGFVRRYRANAYRRLALAELRAARSDPAAIASILRRTALAAYPRRLVAGLSGEDWLRFLNETGRTRAFSGDAGRVLLQAPYRRCETSRLLAEEAERWIRRHQKRRGTKNNVIPRLDRGISLLSFPERNDDRGQGT